ncbi:hypothetical protein A2Y85_02590 [candidate division WOR-3 bacterium RBG_13_43_14]|uniref:Inositol-1-monophosphatase n=1 Tax=candidate division WOR-3 bacterium RBG_13_43_14 TaxID=1802590 RepID=A0A1F4U913_UNCW3|nr:MAG: hypothetical protein A2Y85_02590 [candidate division WOR-3 bacterium RBG_13_43_14]
MKGFIERLTKNVGDDIYRKSSAQKHVKFKSEIDLITRFDRSSQRQIVTALRREFPGFGILSEEGLCYKKDAPIRWIIDPLDGTTNFVHGLPIWSITIALEIFGNVIVGIVYDPTRREMFSAIKENGAAINGKYIRVSSVRSLDRALLVTGFPYDIRRSKKDNLNHFNQFAKKAQAVRRLGSAALDLCYTACGRFDGYWEIKLSPWDQAAGSLILKEAGGRITDFNNNKFDIYGDEVLATNGLIHKQMQKLLRYGQKKS